MIGRRYADLARFAIGLAILALWVWLEVQGFRDFRGANPDSTYWAYLADRWPTMLAAVLIVVGIYAVIYWWGREPKPEDDITEFHETESR